jgi:hypothetical protein
VPEDLRQHIQFQPSIPRQLLHYLTTTDMEATVGDAHIKLTPEKNVGVTDIKEDSTATILNEPVEKDKGK